MARAAGARVGRAWPGGRRTKGGGFIAKKSKKQGTVRNSPTPHRIYTTSTYDLQHHDILQPTMLDSSHRPCYNAVVVHQGT